MYSPAPGDRSRLREMTLKCNTRWVQHVNVSGLVYGPYPTIYVNRYWRMNDAASYHRRRKPEEDQTSLS